MAMMFFFFLLFSVFLLVLFQLQPVVLAAGFLGVGGAPQPQPQPQPKPRARPRDSDECAVTRSCGDYSPDIRFPFWLRDHQPNHCGYPGFQLSCSRTNDTLLEIPFSGTVKVKQNAKFLKV
ncbi:putative RING-H2 finger protein ATL21A [Camellia lanceoleosa]|uniref:RING-H2 finger protein ATL21A n=1 Tax=Camellia lanceoleosa TaxID=1840588 RepID=A0ACC0H4R9_9ERIC|nr:putative RING-H2 finger protein ATL21A [Camellia lanceoleosa]